MHMAQLLGPRVLTNDRDENVDGGKALRPTYVQAKAGLRRLKGNSSRVGCYPSVDVDNFNILKRAAVIDRQ